MKSMLIKQAIGTQFHNYYLDNMYALPELCLYTFIKKPIKQDNKNNIKNYNIYLQFEINACVCTNGEFLSENVHFIKTKTLIP